MCDATLSLSRVYIYCEDERFGRAMAHEVARLGLDVIFSSVLTHVSSDAALVVVDGDDRCEAEWEVLRRESACPWIIWSREPISVQRAVCLRRPFDLEEFVHMVQTCLADTGIKATWPVIKPFQEEWSVRVLREGVLSVKGMEVILTPGEWKLYRCLYEHRGEMVSREALRAVLDGAGGNAVDVYVCHLRSKLEKPLGVRMITTVRGLGYRME